MASTYPEWVFDNSPIPDPLGHGERAVQFLRRLRHPASTEPKRAFQLDPWQERIVRRVYGPRHPDGSRIVKEVWLQVPRGNRKTSLAAALALLHLLGPEKVPAGQIVFAASDREQAGIGFREAAEIIRQDKRLEGVTKIHDAFNSAKMIKDTRDGSTLKAVSSDGKAQHGTTPTFVLCDEIHVWKGRDLFEALRSGMTKRAGGLWITATTAGRGREGLAYDRYSYMRKIALGEIVNPEILPVIFEPGEDDDWLDEATWHKVNPGLSYGYPVLSEMRTKATEARENPSEAYSFRQYALNEWLGNSTAPLFNMDTFDARQLEDDEDDLEALDCWIGVDYASSGDLSAIVAAWAHPDGQVTIRPWFFVQAETLEERERLEGLPYKQWVRDGLIEAVPGPVVPQQVVADKIVEICARHNVQEVAYDPHKLQAMAAELYTDGLPMVQFRQNLTQMGPANGELVRAVNGRLIRHDGNAVLRRHFEGVYAVERNGLIWQDKADKKHGHIDGSVAAAMAVGRLALSGGNSSAYNAPGAGGLYVF